MKGEWNELQQAKLLSELGSIVKFYPRLVIGWGATQAIQQVPSNEKVRPDFLIFV